MNLADALNIMGLDTTSIEKSELKKRYKKLIKDNHPDTGGDAEKAVEINIAYEVICDEMDAGRLSKIISNIKKQERSLIITAMQLIDIYSDRSIEVGGKVYTRDNIFSNKIYVKFDGTLIVDGVKQRISEIILKDEYDKFRIPVIVSSDTKHIELEIYGNARVFDMETILMTVNIRLEAGILISLEIQKV